MSAAFVVARVTYKGLKAAQWRDMILECYAEIDSNFNPCGIFEKMTSFSPILTKTWNKGN